ncbi:MAG: S8 family serine peptidase, partial [Trueperaceae bacterium]|nr:S8 family serine peptidase [Trueperaceae bacterium]
TDVTARPSPWTHVRKITDTLHVLEADAARGAVRTAAARLAAAPGVVGVAPDAVVAPAIHVDDPRAADQWALSAAGVGVAHDLLAVGPPAAPVTVAVIDGAIDLGHPELVASLLPGLDVCSRVEDGGCAGIDDDPGADDEPVPPLDHGTHVAGIVAAPPDDGVGIAGVAPNARILPVKVFHADAGCATRISDLVTALRWSVGLPVDGLPANPHPADVVNLSLSGGTTSDLLQAEIDAVRATGAVIVAAAGNDGGSVLPFPASADGVVAVGATTRYGVRASFSNARRSDAGGPGHLDLMAPGADILSTVPGGHDFASGTSMAAPHVAGAVATLLGREPDLAPDAVLARLQAATYVDPTIMTPDTYGAGVLRLDALHGAPAPRTHATRTAELHVTQGGAAFRAPFDLDRGVARVAVDGEGPVDLHLTWDGATYR